LIKNTIRKCAAILILVSLVGCGQNKGVNNQSKAETTKEETVTKSQIETGENQDVENTKARNRKWKRKKTLKHLILGLQCIIILFMNPMKSRKTGARKDKNSSLKMETFMRMVESGNGITFIPELAVHQLSTEQKELVRPFAIPKPARQIILATRTDFIRSKLLSIIIESIRDNVPKQMHTLQAIQRIV
jgi:predicted small lipoprotein YifL